MKLNRLTEESPFSHTFSRAFRVGGAIHKQGENFLTPPKIDENDAARVLVSSRGELKIDGKGEELSIEKSGPKRDKNAPSLLQNALKRLSGITKDIQSIQENIDDGFYGSEEQSTTAQDELSKLRDESGRIVNSENFQAAVDGVKKVRADLTGLTDEELYGKLDGQLPLIGNAVQELATNKKASIIERLSRNLGKILDGVSSGDSLKTIEQLQKSIEQASEIDSGGKTTAEETGQFGSLLSNLQETVRRLRFLKEGEEKGLFSKDQLEGVKGEQQELQARYKEILQSDNFSKITDALKNIAHLRQGKGGAPAAATFAEGNKGLLGGALSSLLSEYRFGDIEKLNKSVAGLTKAGETLETLTSEQLGKLSNTISTARDVVSGDSLRDKESRAQKESISLNESVFEKNHRKYASILIDEVEDLFKITEKNARGTYFLLTEKTTPKGNILDVLS